MKVKVGDLVSYGPDLDGYSGLALITEISELGGIHVDWLSSKDNGEEHTFCNNFFWESDILRDNNLWRKLS